MKIVSLAERDGQKRSFHLTSINVTTLSLIFNAQIDAKARLITNEAKVHKKFGKEFAHHESVNHGAENMSVVTLRPIAPNRVLQF